MRLRNFYREATVLLCAVIAALITILARPPLSSDDLIFDLLIQARAAFFPSSSRQSNVAIVAIDWRSSKSSTLSQYPRMLLRPIYARLINEIFTAEPAAMGFDILFEEDLSHVPGLSKGFDSPFIAAVAAHRDKIVLGRQKSLLPFPALLDAAGTNDLASLNIPKDGDGTTRRDVRGFWRDGVFTPTLYAALVARADPTIRLPSELLLAPRRHLETLPAYSLIDVLQCADDPVALAQAFRGKVVLVGVVTPFEDRVATSGRFLQPVAHNSPPTAPCGLRTLGASNPASNTVPGVFLHAAAADEVMSGDLTATASAKFVAMLGALAVAIIALTAMFLSPSLAIIVAILLLATIAAVATAALQHGLYIPIMLPMLATSVTPLGAYAARYLVEQRSRRSIENAFNHYLSPSIVAKLAEDPGTLKLGGERRVITVMFADLSGFTTMSGQVEPEILTAKMNKYLGLVSEQVEATGGYVDKFIGDAVMAIWGAPATDPNHAVNGVRAALGALESVERARLYDQALGEPGFSIKFGINSGPAVVGNVGTERRYNYTAVGQTVNIASRLEAVPHLYHCHIVLGSATAELCKDAYLMRELDRIMVKGANAPLPIFEVICELSKASTQQINDVERYREALGMYREWRFREAAVVWEKLDKRGPVSNGNAADPGPRSAASAMAMLARELASNPPPSGWDGTRILTTK